MARRGRPDEWSCPLCTLINAWRDRRCAACDNERPATLDAPASAAPAPAPAQAQAAPPPALQLVYREAPGVFFRSEGCGAAWARESRLAVNRRPRKRAGQWSGTNAYVQAPPVLQSDREGSEVTADSGGRHTAESEAKPPVTLRAASASQELEEVDVPCFNLLGPSMGMFGGAAVDPPSVEPQDVNNQVIDVDMDNGAGSSVVSIEDRRMTDRPVGFIPASRVLQEAAIEEKLTSAGLDLSDSDDDSDSGATRLRQKNRPLSPVREADSETSGPSWECPVCTNFNAQWLTSCDLCDTPKAQDDECSICSKKLRPDADKCDRCGTLRAPGERANFAIVIRVRLTCSPFHRKRNYRQRQ